MKKIALIIAIGMFASLAWANSKTHYAKVKIFQPISIGETVDVVGVFEGLSPGARKLGLNDSQIEGTINYKDLGQNKTRVTITWHTIKVNVGNYTENEPLEQRLVSKFITDADVDPNTSVKAKGSLAKVLDAFKSAQRRAEDKAKKAGFETNTVADDANEQKASDLSPQKINSGTSSTGGSAGTSGSTNGTGSSTAPATKADLETEEKQVCTHRIDEAGGYVYTRQKIVKSAGGTVTSESPCQDTGDKFKIETTADKCGFKAENNELYLEKRKFAKIGSEEFTVQTCTLDKTDPQPTEQKRADCGVLTDEAKNLVYLKYKKIGTVDGREVVVTECTTNLDQSIPIDHSFIGCRVRHDFFINKSIQQEKISFKEGEEVKPLNGNQCKDSTTVYDHFLTEQTCKPINDTASNSIILQKRVAYNNNQGQIEFAAECKPIPTDSFDIKEKVCEDDKYEHDFSSRVSYLKTKTFYTHPTNGDTDLTECARSTSKQFTHIFNKSDCSANNNDSSKTTTFRYKRYIEEEGGNQLEIEGCEPSGDAIPYVLTSQKPTTLIRNIAPATTAYGYGHVNTFANFVTGSVSFQHPYELVIKPQVSNTLQHLTGAGFVFFNGQTYHNSDPSFQFVCKIQSVNRYHLTRHFLASFSGSVFHTLQATADH